CQRRIREETAPGRAARIPPLDQTPERTLSCGGARFSSPAPTACGEVEPGAPVGQNPVPPFRIPCRAPRHRPKPWNIAEPHAITLLGGKVEFYIPHRIDEGYGLNADAIRQLCDQGAQLIVTVDCGVTATEQAKVACERGVDLIITDHHEWKESGPGCRVSGP